ITRLGTVEALARDGLARPRFLAALFGTLAAIATLLAVVGVYGTTAYAPRTRRREIGVRLALGARRARVVGATAGRAALVVAAGVVLGLGGAWLAARRMREAFVYVEPGDGATLGTVGLLVLVAGSLAAWLPARRAARVD